MLAAHQDSRYDEWGFSGSVRFDPGQAGRGLSLDVTPSFGAAAQGTGRLWAAQDMGGLTPYGAPPFDMGGQLAAEVGYGTAGPGRGEALRGPDAVRRGPPRVALRVPVGGQPAVQRRRRGRADGRLRRPGRGGRSRQRPGALGTGAGADRVLSGSGARRAWEP